MQDLSFSYYLYRNILEQTFCCGLNNFSNEVTELECFASSDSSFHSLTTEGRKDENIDYF